jgi:hypothetical protein
MLLSGSTRTRGDRTEEERRGSEEGMENCFEFIPQNCTKQKDFKMIKMPLIQKTTKVEKQRGED